MTWIDDDRRKNLIHFGTETAEYIFKILETYLDNYSRSDLVSQFHAFLNAISNWDISFTAENNSFCIVGDSGVFKFEASQTDTNANSKNYNIFKITEGCDKNSHKFYLQRNSDTRGEGEYCHKFYDSNCEHQDYPLIVSKGFILNGKEYETHCEKHATEGCYHRTNIYNNDGIIIHTYNTFNVNKQIFYDFLEKELKNYLDSDAVILPQNVLTPSKLKEYAIKIKRLGLEDLGELGDYEIFDSILIAFKTRVVNDFRQYFNDNFDETEPLDINEAPTSVFYNNFDKIINVVAPNFVWGVNLECFVDELSKENTSQEAPNEPEI